MRRMAALTSCVVLLASTVTPASAQQPAADGGGQIFNAYCVACHTIGQGVRVGPDLSGVVSRRPEEWLRRVIREPDRMLADGDPVFTQLFNTHNRVPMPDLGLSEEQVGQVVEYLRSTETGDAADAEPPARGAAAESDVAGWPRLGGPQAVVLALMSVLSMLVAIVIAGVVSTTWIPRQVDTARAYRFRQVLFVAGVVVLGGTFLATVPASPYNAYRAPTNDVDRIVYVTGRQFLFTFSAEPITNLEDMGRIQPISNLTIPIGSTVEFRVTSLDVTHGFGLYDPNRQVIAQTQAMPRYVNRLRVRLTQPGEYSVICLEYCAAGHHYMRASLKVQ